MRILIGLLASVLVGQGCRVKEPDTMPEVETWIRDEFPDVPRISPEELSAWLEDETRPAPLLLDVRQREEYEVSHLQNARHAGSLDQALQILAGLPKDTPVVAYCAVGYRSSRLAEQLQELGWTNVANLEGSIFRWANEGRPVVREGKVVVQVHPYSKNWEHLLDRRLRADLSAAAGGSRGEG